MRFDHPVHHGQSQTRATLPRREEWIEHARQILLRNARPRIAHAQANRSRQLDAGRHVVVRGSKLDHHTATRTGVLHRIQHGSNTAQCSGSGSPFTTIGSRRLHVFDFRCALRVRMLRNQSNCISSHAREITELRLRSSTRLNSMKSESNRLRRFDSEITSRRNVPRSSSFRGGPASCSTALGSRRGDS